MPQSGVSTFVHRLPSPAVKDRFPLTVRPLVHDVGMTVVTEALVLATGLVLVSLFGRLLGAVALAEYLLFRRVAAGLQSGVNLGLGVAVPRYVGFTVNGPTGKPEAYFLVALISLTTLAVLLGSFLMLGRRHFADWFFGSPQKSQLVPALCLVLISLAVQAAVYGYYRGILAMGAANALELCNLALIPLVSVTLLYPTRSVGLIMGVIGGGALCCACLFALPIFRRLLRCRPGQLVAPARELIRYGIGRVPGDFAYAALFAAGPIIAAHFVPLASVSYLLLGLSLLMAVGYCATPLGLVLLSRISVMLGQGRLQEVQASLEHLINSTLALSLFAALQLAVFADLLVRIWVGPGFLEGIFIIRLLFLAVPASVFYIALRSPIDAASPKPYNAGNVIVALASYIVLAAVAAKVLPPSLALKGITVAFLGALVGLGVLTARSVRQLYEVTISWTRCAPSLLVGLLLGGISIFFRWMLLFQTGLFEAVVFELAISALFLGFLIKLNPPWLGFVGRILLAGRRREFVPKSA